MLFFKYPREILGNLIPTNKMLIVSHTTLLSRSTRQLRLQDDNKQKYDHVESTFIA